MVWVRFQHSNELKSASLNSSWYLVINRHAPLLILFEVLFEIHQSFPPSWSNMADTLQAFDILLNILTGSNSLASFRWLAAQNPLVRYYKCHEHSGTHRAVVFRNYFCMILLLQMHAPNTAYERPLFSFCYKLHIHKHHHHTFSFCLLCFKIIQKHHNQ